MSPTPSRADLGRMVMVMPTYNESMNLAWIVGRLRVAEPDVDVLVVDDGSPDGTGRIADELAAADPQVKVVHRTQKAGLGAAYRAGFRVALDAGYDVIGEMDADGSHQPEQLHRLLDALRTADLVIGSRYVKGGGTVDWGIVRRVISRAGSLFARTLLRLEPHDLTGGFKAWRSSTLAAVPFDGIHAGGYVFQIETTFRASRAGARVREVPIVFPDRRIGQSKMSRRILVEALLVVINLWWEEQRERFRRRPAEERTGK